MSVLPNTYKILSNILLSRLTPYGEEITGDHQCGFRRKNSATDHIFCVRKTLQRKWKYTEAVHHLFIDFKKAYDSFRREVLYNILNEFDIPMKLIRLIKMCLNETCSRVRVCKHLSDMFHINNGLKQGDALSSLLFDIALEYTIRRVQVNQDGLKLNGTRQLLVYTDGVNIMDRNVQTIKKIPEALLIGSKEIGLDINADETKHMVMTVGQNAGRSHSIKNDNTSFERMEKLKYLGTA